MADRHRYGSSGQGSSAGGRGNEPPRGSYPSNPSRDHTTKADQEIKEADERRERRSTQNLKKHPILKDCWPSEGDTAHDKNKKKVNRVGMVTSDYDTQEHWNQREDTTTGNKRASLEAQAQGIRIVDYGYSEGHPSRDGPQNPFRSLTPSSKASTPKEWDSDMDFAMDVHQTEEKGKSKAKHGGK